MIRGRSGDKGRWNGVFFSLRVVVARAGRLTFHVTIALVAAVLFDVVVLGKGYVIGSIGFGGG